LGVEAVRAGKGAEVEVEGAVFLEQDEDVLDVLSEELELHLWREVRLAGDVGCPMADFASGRGRGSKGSDRLGDA
jgi:hypothetical protein